jgi:hypothetical protein
MTSFDYLSSRRCDIHGYFATRLPWVKGGHGISARGASLRLWIAAELLRCGFSVSGSGTSRRQIFRRMVVIAALSQPVCARLRIARNGFLRRPAAQEAYRSWYHFLMV